MLHCGVARYPGFLPLSFPGVRAPFSAFGHSSTSPLRDEDFNERELTFILEIIMEFAILTIIACVVIRAAFAVAGAVQRFIDASNSVRCI